MLDAKVLAAVFASLTAIATTMNGGAIQPDMAVNGVSAELSNINDINGLNTGSLDTLKQLFINRPEPSNDVTAVLTVSGLENEKIKLQKADLKASDLRKIKLGSRKMSSDSEIIFEGFKGSVTAGDPSTIQGSTQSILSSGVNISGPTIVSEKVNSSRININERGRAKIALSNVKGRIDSGSASTDISSNTKLKINSFSGKMTIYPGNNSLRLEGEVDRLSAGKFSFGG